MALAPVALFSDPLEDYPANWIKFYEQGTTTPLAMAINSSGSPTVAKAEVSSGGVVPIGFVKTAGDVIFIPYVDEAYDLYLFPTEAEADANDTSNAIQLADNVNYLQILPNRVGGILVDDLIADTNLLVGDFVSTVGYTTSGDGGDNDYEIVAGGTGTDDGGGFIDLDGGLQAKGLFPGGRVTVKQFGAIPDGTNLSAKVQAAFDFGAQETIFPEDSGIYLCQTLNVTMNQRVIRGEGYPILQAFATGNALFADTTGVDLLITGLALQGVPGSAESSANRVMRFTSFTGIKIIDNIFRNCFERALYLIGCQQFEVSSNRFEDCSNGPYFTGCKRGAINKNILNNSQQDLGTFKAGIFLQTFDVTFGLNEDVSVVDNKVNNYGNGQAIVCHGGAGITISDNTTNRVAQGINLNPAGNANNSFTDFTITGNRCKGVGAVAYAVTSDVGIVLSATGSVSDNIVVADNTLRNYNLDELNQNLGGISVIGMDNVIIHDNAIKDCGVNGIVFSGADSNNANVHHNNISGISLDAAGGGIKVDSPTVVTGAFRDNQILESQRAYRLETSALPDLIVESATEQDNTGGSTGTSAVIFNGSLTPVSADTTPTVGREVDSISFNNAGATTISDLDNGVLNQVIVMRDPSGNTTISEDSGSGGNFKLSVNSDFAFGANDTLTVMKSGTVWLEISRSLN